MKRAKSQKEEGTLTFSAYCNFNSFSTLINGDFLLTLNQKKTKVAMDESYFINNQPQITIIPEENEKTLKKVARKLREQYEGT